MTRDKAHIFSADRVLSDKAQVFTSSDSVVKGIVLPKMKDLSSFTVPHVIPNSNLFILFWGTQKEIFAESPDCSFL